MRARSTTTSSRSRCTTIANELKTLYRGVLEARDTAAGSAVARRLFP